MCSPTAAPAPSIDRAQCEGALRGVMGVPKGSKQGGVGRQKNTRAVGFESTASSAAAARKKARASFQPPSSASRTAVCRDWCAERGRKKACRGRASAARAVARVYLNAAGGLDASLLGPNERQCPQRCHHRHCRTVSPRTVGVGGWRGGACERKKATKRGSSQIASQPPLFSPPKPHLLPGRRRPRPGRTEQRWRASCRKVGAGRVKVEREPGVASVEKKKSKSEVVWAVATNKHKNSSPLLATPPAARPSSARAALGPDCVYLGLADRRCTRGR